MIQKISINSGQEYLPEKYPQSGFFHVEPMGSVIYVNKTTSICVYIEPMSSFLDVYNSMPEEVIDESPKEKTVSEKLMLRALAVSHKPELLIDIELNGKE